MDFEDRKTRGRYANRDFTPDLTARNIATQLNMQFGLGEHVPTSLMMVRQRSRTHMMWEGYIIPSVAEKLFYRALGLEYDVTVAVRAECSESPILGQLMSFHRHNPRIDPRDSRKFGAINWFDVVNRPCHVFRDCIKVYSSTLATESLKAAMGYLEGGDRTYYASGSKNPLTLKIPDSIQRTAAVINGIRAGGLPYNDDMKSLAMIFEDWDIATLNIKDAVVHQCDKLYQHGKQNNVYEGIYYFNELKELSVKYGVSSTVHDALRMNMSTYDFRKHLEEADDVLRTFGFYDESFAGELAFNLLDGFTRKCARDIAGLELNPNGKTSQLLSSFGRINH